MQQTKMSGQRVYTKTSGYGYYAILHPVADSAGFWIKGEIELNNHMVPVEKDPYGIWHEVGFLTSYVPHPDGCVCDDCNQDYYEMTGEM